jgi:hypothetical protein
MVGFIEPVGTQFQSARLDLTGITTKTKKKMVIRHSFQSLRRNFAAARPAQRAAFRLIIFSSINVPADADAAKTHFYT